MPGPLKSATHINIAYLYIYIHIHLDLKGTPCLAKHNGGRESSAFGIAGNASSRTTSSPLAAALAQITLALASARE
jgi:hypothetical protein